MKNFKLISVISASLRSVVILSIGSVMAGCVSHADPTPPITSPVSLVQPAAPRATPTDRSMSASEGVAPAPLARPAPIDEYVINSDGGIVYNPLAREATKTGQITAYNNVPRTSHQLTLGDCKVDLQVPKRAVPYDVVPIPYTLTWAEGTHFPLGVEANAFEEPARTGGKDLYDPSLPHHIDLSSTYVGSVTANFDPAQKQNLTPDFTDKPGSYPGFVSQPLVRSGTVAAGDLVWFKFHLVNTGDTILSSEGFGGSLLYPELLRKDANGVYQHFANPYNLYYRNLHTWYPGESWDPWIIFSIPAAGQPAEYYHLPPGDYKINIRLAYRNYKYSDPGPNYWDGPIVYTYEQPITVEATARQTPVTDGVKLPSGADYPDKLPTFIHTFEQFMTAFDLQLKPPASSERTIHGVLNLQVAPWTHNVVLKLIGNDSNSIKTAIVPIAIDDESPRVAVKPDMHNTIVRADGTRWPVFESQIMGDMRANVQLGPHPEDYINSDLETMKELGVNVVCTTEMPWFFADMSKPTFSIAGDAGKYALDVARRKGLKVDAWGLYPPDRAPALEQEASWVTGKNYNTMENIQSGYGYGASSVSPVDPRFGEAYAAIVGYDYKRWGDIFFQNSNGDVPIDIEDTRGWLRDDVNVHYPVGAPGTIAFRKWVQAKYGTIEKTNSVWGSNFASFDAIDPETHQANVLLWSYKDQNYPFHEWNQAMADFDEWRTIERVDFYRDILQNLRPEIPKAKMELRTEGGNIIVAGLDPESPDLHIRHAYYGQQRGALVAAPILASGLVGYHSDYTTMPYTPSELRTLVAMSVKQGIVPTYLPCFSDMRDIAINPDFGTDDQMNYNISNAAKGYMMHTLTASFPWYKIMEEEGGVPGVLWSDFQCDAYVTETQVKEMQFLQHKLKEALTHYKPTRPQDVPSQVWRHGSLAMRSYNLPANVH